MAKPKKKRWQTPRVVFQPQVHQGLGRGISQLVSAISPTLGPLPRVVVNKPELDANHPEFLNDGAVIARRIVQLPHRDEDMGAMYLRQMLWKLHETSGDGTATAAVMFETIFKQGVRYLTSGGNAMLLRHHLEKATGLILDQLDHDYSYQREGKLSGLAETICYDPPLARMLGEIFDIIGPYGILDVRSGRSRDLEREYIEGMYWTGGVLSREMITDPALGRAQVEDAAILISDLEAVEPQDLFPLLEAAIQAGIKSLFLVLESVSDRALSVILQKTNREKIHVVAVKAPAVHADVRRGALEDLAMITGGRVYYRAAGDTLRNVDLSSLGQVRRAWANPTHFGIVGGRGEPCKVRQHLAQLRAAFINMKDADERKRLQERIGKLMGGSATLWVGAATPFEVDQRKELAMRTAEAMRGAMREGVLPGGGVALIACKDLLERKRHEADESDERAAYNILIQAIETPLRILLINAGFDPSDVFASIHRAGPGFGFDVLRGQVVDMSQAGIFDAASVVKAAVFGAIHGAALALTVDVLVHRKNPQMPPSRPSSLDQDQLMQSTASQIQDYIYQIVGSGKTFFAACNTGLYRSEDGGKTWQTAYRSLELSEPLPTIAVAVSPDFEHDPRLFAGLNGGIFRSLNGGQDWVNIHLPPPPPVISALAISPNFEQDGIVFAATMEDGVLFSADRGESFTTWNFGLLDLNILCLAVSPNFSEDETVFAGTQSGIFRSTNGGRAWREVDLPVGYETVLSLALSPDFARDGILLAGTETRGLLLSTDKGASWQQVGAEVFTMSVNAVVLAPDFAARQEILALQGGSLFHSADRGASWTPWREKILADKDVTALLAPAGFGPGVSVLIGCANGAIENNV